MTTQTELAERLNALERSGQYDTLLREIELYMNDNPDLQPLYYYKGNVLRHKGDLQGALSAYRWAILLDPNDAKARTYYAATLFDLKDYAGALNAADAAILIDPDQPDPYLICGNILSLLGFPEQAVYPYHHAYEFMPDNISLGSYVAELYSQQNEPDDAFELMMQLLARDEHNGALQVQMACMLYFFMQNGVPLEKVEEWTQKWADAYKNPYSEDVLLNILNHNLNYTPLSTGVLERVFDDLSVVYDTIAEEDAILFVNVLENALRPYFQDKKDLTVLDIGCGTGLAASPIRQYTTQGRLSGIDLSSKLLAIAQTRKIYTDFFHQDAMEFLADKRQEYDVLIAADSLPYMDDLNKAFSVFNVALKSKGMMFFSIKHNGLNEENEILYPPYNYLFNSNYIHSVLKNNGFEVKTSFVMQEGSDTTIHDKKYFYVVQKIE